MQVRELLQAFGTLKAFNLVTDRDTGASKVCIHPMVNLVVYGPIISGTQEDPNGCRPHTLTLFIPDIVVSPFE